MQINGITVSQEQGHYLLKRNNIEMRCDFNELNDSISEFEEYLKEAKQKFKQDRRA